MSSLGQTPDIQSTVNANVKNIDKTRASKFVVDTDDTNKTLTIASGSSGIFFTTAKNTSQFAMVDISIKQTSGVKPLILTIDFGQDANNMVKSYEFTFQTTSYIQSIPIQGNYFNFDIFNNSTSGDAVLDVKLQFRNYVDNYPKNQIQFETSENAIAQLVRVGNEYYDDLATGLTGATRYVHRYGRITNLPSYPSMIFPGTGVSANLNTSNTAGTMKFETLTIPSASDDGQIQIIGQGTDGERQFELVVLTNGEGTSTKQFTHIESMMCQQGFQPTQDIKVVRTGTTDLYSYIEKDAAMTQIPYYFCPRGASSAVLKEIRFRGFVGNNPSPIVSVVQVSFSGSGNQKIKRYQTRLVDTTNIDMTVTLNMKIQNRNLIYLEVTGGATIGALTELDLTAEMVIIEDYVGQTPILQFN